MAPGVLEHQCRCRLRQQAGASSVSKNRGGPGGSGLWPKFDSVAVGTGKCREEIPGLNETRVEGNTRYEGIGARVESIHCAG